MKKLISTLFFILLISTQFSAQNILSNNLSSPNLENYFIYYNFYNGVQMIEIDNLKWGKVKAQHLDGIQPINTTHAWSIPAVPNAYIFRNDKGEILKQFNTLDNTFQASDFISPVNLKGKTRPHKSDQPTLNIENNAGFYSKFNKPDFGDYVFKVYGATNNYGIIDTLGNLVADTIYDAINYTKDNYYFKKNGQWGLMDANFETIIQPKYKALSYLRNNTHYACIKDGCGIINSNEKVLVDFKYKEIASAKSFYFYAVDNVPDTLHYADGTPLYHKIKKYGIMDLNFNITTQPIYYDLKQFNQNYYWASKSTGHGMIDSSGNEISPFRYLREPVKVNFGHYLIAVNLKDTKHGNREFRGFLDSTFKEVGEIKYHNVGFFVNGFGSVCIDDKWGFINEEGKQVVDCKYDHVNPMRNGFSIIHDELSDEEATDSRQDRYGVIDKSGKTVIPITYHGVDVDKDGTYVMCMYYKETLPNDKIEWKSNCDYYLPINGKMKKKEQK